MKNKILKGSFALLFVSLPGEILELLDAVCSKVNDIYKNRPSLLPIQSFMCAFAATTFLSYSNFMKGLDSDDTGTSTIKEALIVAETVYVMVIVLISYYAISFPTEYRHGTPPAMRAGMQWLLQALISYLTEKAKGQAWWVDWYLTVTILLFLCHLVSLFKSFGKLRNMGSADVFMSIANALAEELLRNLPTIKLLSTMFFALIVLYREHRARVKREREMLMIFFSLRRKMLIIPPPSPQPVAEADFVITG